jgi:integrase
MYAAGLTRPTGKVDRKTKQRSWVPIYTMYALRHFYASMLIAQGHQPKQVQRLLGHSNVQMTLEVYGHLWDDAERDQAIADGVGKFLAG